MAWLLHDIAAAYGWLYAMGLWRSVLGAVVVLLVGYVLKLGKRLRQIEHHLDTSTPGGLTDVVNAMNRTNNADGMN